MTRAHTCIYIHTITLLTSEMQSINGPACKNTGQHSIVYMEAVVA